MITKWGSPPCQAQAGGDQQENVPKPQKGVDFVVDHIEGHHAHGVMPLDRARRTILVKCALCHLGKDHIQRIDAGFQALAPNVGPQAHKLSPQEPVSDVDLQQHIEEVEALAQNEVHRPGAANVKPVQKRLSHHPDLVLPGSWTVKRRSLGLTGSLLLGPGGDVLASHPYLLLLQGEGRQLQPVHQVLEPASFQPLPHVVGGVEHQRLSKQDERHPLVVGVVRDLVLGLDAVLPHAGVGQPPLVQQRRVHVLDL